MSEIQVEFFDRLYAETDEWIPLFWNGPYLITTTIYTKGIWLLTLPKTRP